MQQLEKVNLVMRVEKEVRNLSKKFATLEKVLHDAERRRVKEKDVGVWMEELEDITYEMEDVLDEWNIKILQPKNLCDEEDDQLKARKIPTLLLEKVRSLIPSMCFCLKQVPMRSDIASKLKKINGKLELTLREANQFSFITRHFESSEFKRPMSTSMFDESKVHGREFDKDCLLKHLISKSSCSGSSKIGDKNGVKLISIVGAGGSGKTTLAQILYNDDRVKQDFELRKWICVSNPFDEKRIVNALLESPERNIIPNMSELESLFQLFRESFSRKKFLVVLDDVWTEDSLKWEPFRDSFKDGASGSIILVTTRSERVARAIGTDYKHTLGLLSDLDCWLILKRIALFGRPELCERVEKIGQKIAEKCKGLPLAAKTLGSLLQFKDTVQEWQDVLDSKIWQMEEAAVDLFPHFYLSYNELSPQLKRCFSYCAVFPKDTHICVQDLIRLWMAQGYLAHSSQRRYERMEKKGYEYFKNLAMRSFFQELERDNLDENVVLKCKMHDIVHDFAQFLTKNECCAVDEFVCNKSYTNGGRHLYKERARHITWLSKTKSIRSVPLDIRKLQSLFIITQLEVHRDLFSHLKSVRTLTMASNGLYEIPREIGNLIHLRHLDLSGNPLEELPETICDLYFLETLNLTFCNMLQHLPQRIGDLVHLRHLLNYGTDDLEELPPGFRKLTAVRTLAKFNAGRGRLNDIAKLKDFNQLERLGIFTDYNVDFGHAKLGKKIYLQYLELHFERKGRWMEVIELPPNLRTLLLRNYPGTQLPKCIVVESIINNLVSLTILNALNVSSLPTLWKLSCLEYLRLYELPNLKHLGREFFGLMETMHNVNDDDEDGVYYDAGVVAFRSLKTLFVQCLKNLEAWEDLSEEDEKIKGVTVMPRLQNFTICGCNMLDALPHRILGKSSSLKLLVVRHCSILVGQYSDRNGDDWKRLSHIPFVQIV